MKKVVIAGGSGFIGQALAERFRASGHNVVILSRSGKDGAVRWDGMILGSWSKELEGAAAVINLSGESAILQWTTENRRRILDSRVDSTRVLGAAIGVCKDPPRMWVNASAVGYYGDTGDREVDESARAAEGFLADVCHAWEDAIDEKRHPHTRTVRLRIGFPLGNGGGLTQLANLTRLFLGGSAGGGEQFVPWIHIDDLTNLAAWCIENEGTPEVVNGVGPSPVRNKDFMTALRRTLKRPWSPPAPAFVMKAIAALVGIQVDPILESSRVVPTAALRGGFEFKFTDLDSALRDLLQPAARSPR